MPEAKKKDRKHSYESQAASHLGGLRVNQSRAESLSSADTAQASEQRPGEAGQPPQPALVSKLIDFIKTL